MNQPVMISGEVDQTITDLTRAIEILKESPWDQGQDFREDTLALCAYGAVRVATGGLVLDKTKPYGHHNADVTSRYTSGSMDFIAARGLRDRASNVCRAFKRIMGDDIVKYNDAENRTKDQVIRAMETVLAELKKDPSRA